jgi:hypothetical protein
MAEETLEANLWSSLADAWELLTVLISTGEKASEALNL